ncbi:MAG TPA: hypothetical protein VKK79_18890 [Candidatus Lokiarchaeia archaeon]|nr:hypothetical protein [Candidatus Lokiarchaeia archaeon]
MASKKKPLNAYVGSRKEKYKRPYRFLFHISVAPRKYLQPRRTPFQSSTNDEDRSHPALFLCPLKDIKEWVGWVSGKTRNSSNECSRKRFGKGGFVTLYVHVVRVNPKELRIPDKRYCQEFILTKTLIPLAIIPIRYYLDRSLQLGKVASLVKQLKKYGRHHGK